MGFWWEGLKCVIVNVLVSTYRFISRYVKCRVFWEESLPYVQRPLMWGFRPREHYSLNDRLCRGSQHSSVYVTRVKRH